MVVDLSAESPVRSQDRELARLVLVATSAWLLSKRDSQLLGMRHPPRHDAEVDGEPAVGELLRRVLDPALPGRAWLCRDSADFVPRLAETRPAETRPAGMRPAEEPPQEHVPWLAPSDAEPLITEIETDLAATMDSAKPEPDLDPLRHRVFLDADRLNALARGRVTRVPFWVLIDLRFSYLFDQLRCHAAVSVWSVPPLTPRYCPEAVNGETAPHVVDLGLVRDAFTQVAGEVAHLLDDHLYPIRIDVFENDYTLPTFWVAVPAVPPPDPMDYLDSKSSNDNSDWVDWTSELSERLLGPCDARDHSLTRSVLNGELMLLRRVVRTDLPYGYADVASHNVPTYVVLPGGRDLIQGTPETLPQRQSKVERDTADVITQLTDLEAEAANLLHLRQRDLEIWSNHLKVYNAVVERGAFLWDALSTHLMIRWGAWFEKAHSAVDMLHQVLQQAVADLRHIATLTQRAVARIDEAKELLQDSYDHRIGERHLPHEPGLRAALTETGFFGRSVSQGAEVLNRAERVKIAYDDLLKAISGAFEERRVRELDGTQKAGFFVGFFAALIGLVTVVDATINVKPDAESGKTTIWGSPQFLDDIAMWFSIGIGVTVMVLSGILAYQVSTIGRLGTITFRNLYHGRNRWWRHPLRRLLVKWPDRGLWRFLKDSSTDSQKRLRLGTLEAMRQEGPGYWQQTWADHDALCTAELMRIWDIARTLRDCERHDDYKDDIRGLSHLIEQWGVHSLLLTERARVMHWFDLPNLTCLYRCCTRIDGSFLDYSDLDPITMVADIDLYLSLMRLGFTRAEAQRIDRWLVLDEFESARQAYDRVGRLKLRVGMTAAERQATLHVVEGKRTAG